MAKIRVGTQGWNGDRAALSQEDCGAGVGIQWVEIDGVRVKEVVSVKLEIIEGFATPVLSVKMLGPMQIVYTDGKGEPLPGHPLEYDGASFAGREAGHDCVIMP